MKRSFYGLLMLGAVAFGFSSCNNGLYDADPKNANTGGNPLNTGGGSGGGSGGGNFNFTGTDPMSAKVDGNSVTYANASALVIPGFIQVNGSSGSDGSTMAVTFAETLTPGTYDLNLNATGTTIGNYTNNSTMFGPAPGTSGKLQIIENDATHVKGKFYFTAKDAFTSGGTKTITEGYFNANK